MLEGYVLFLPKVNHKRTQGCVFALPCSIIHMDIISVRGHVSTCARRNMWLLVNKKDGRCLLIDGRDNRCMHPCQQDGLVPPCRQEKHVPLLEDLRREWVPRLVDLRRENWSPYWVIWWGFVFYAQIVWQLLEASGAGSLIWRVKESGFSQKELVWSNRLSVQSNCSRQKNPAPEFGCTVLYHTIPSISACIISIIHIYW